MPSSWSFLKSTALPLFSLALGVMSATCLGCAASKPAPPAEWWFSHRVPPAGELHYHITHTLRCPSVDVNQRDEREIVVTVETAEGSEGLRWRLAGEWKDYWTPTALGQWLAWIKVWQGDLKSDITVTPNEVRYGQTPILRGPWSTGDRISLLWFVVVTHFEVIHADSQKVSLKFDFSVGLGRPLWSGAGVLSMSVDGDRLQQVRVEWYWIRGDQRCDASLAIDRRD